MGLPKISAQGSARPLALKFYYVPILIKFFKVLVFLYFFRTLNSGMARITHLVSALQSIVYFLG